MKRKQTIIYGVLAGNIFVFLYLLASASYQAPEKLIDPNAYKKAMEMSETETVFSAPDIAQPSVRDPHPSYGKKDIRYL